MHFKRFNVNLLEYLDGFEVRLALFGQGPVVRSQSTSDALEVARLFLITLLLGP